MLVKSIMVDSLAKFPKSSRLHMLYSFVQQEKLKNKFKALFEIFETEQNKPTLQEEFSCHRFRNLIEEEMIEADMRNSESSGMDVNNIVNFQNKFVEFQQTIDKTVNLHLDFWRELMEENPEIHKLQNLGSKITTHIEKCEEIYKKLIEMNPNHIRCLVIYGNFLQEIVSDDTGGAKILEKANYIGKSSMVSKQFTEDKKTKYGENSNTCIVTVSGNLTTMGMVLNSNNEITRILGFAKNDIVGQKVERIMPRIYIFRRAYHQ